MNNSQNKKLLYNNSLINANLFYLYFCLYNLIKYNYIILRDDESRYV